LNLFFERFTYTTDGALLVVSASNIGVQIDFDQGANILAPLMQELQLILFQQPRYFARGIADTLYAFHQSKITR
jgi:hypothetical protein